MRPEVRSATVKYWLAFLPVNTTHEIGTQLMTRSTFILGIMGSDHSEVLSPAITKAVALSLTLLLNDDSKASSRIAAMELLARGFATWEPYLKTSELLRTLFAYATSEPAEFPVSGSSSGLLSSSNTNSSGTTSAQVTRQARNSIFQIATANTPLFVSTMTFDLMNAKKPADRTAILRVISLVVRKKPALLYSSVPRVAEAVVRTLDPNVPNMREVALQTATAMLHDLVKTYPSIDFHGPSQKLAVGTLEGAVIVYDLRTATRWVVLEGHTGPVTALSFSPDGRAVVSCSVQDSTVRMWRPNPGIFGILASSLSAGVPPGAAASGTDKGGRGALSASQKAYRTYPFGIDGGGERQSELPVTIILRDVKFEWPGDKSVRLRVKDMVMTFNV
ncbi:hypothetical protein BC938DRAFT_474774 [Jimgerdemannia flammicorona]|uniref:Uncharacterized protein n=1 Tax=Jimgerdemannia flammicorona TaxID=994334 RepID=A0A433QS86_9FUNG|nr:hypothetical protein BC938DRAFT_474774 [Jimgerdemannia flammicorona]